MSRKLDKQRLYLVIRNLVVILSVLCIGVASIYAYNYNNIADRAYQNSTECLGRFSADICGSFYVDLARVSNIIWYGFGIGFGLLVLFFGGTKMINYLFSEKNSK